MAVISLTETTRLGITKHKATQKCTQTDGLSGLKVVGECHETLTRGKLRLVFDALIVEGLSVDVLGGMNFIFDNNIIPSKLLSSSFSHAS